MRLSAVGYQNNISYKGNNNEARKVEQPVKNKNKMQTVKNIGMAVVGAGLLYLAFSKGKALTKIFGKLGAESKPAVDGSKKVGEKIEEIVPEVLDFDTVWGPKIAARKKAKMQPPKTIVIDEKGNILKEKSSTGSFTDTFGIKNKSGNRTQSAFDTIIDILDDFSWLV